MVLTQGSIIIINPKLIIVQYVYTYKYVFNITDFMIYLPLV